MMLDNNSFEKLVTDRTDSLYRISMAMLRNEHDAEDAVHDAILSAYQNRHKLRSEEYFGTWLTRILINECKKQLRYRKRRADIASEINDKEPRDDPYLSLEISDAINRLPEKIQLTVILYYFEDHSIKEIKSILRVPEGTVKSRLAAGRKLLKNLL